MSERPSVLFAGLLAVAGGGAALLAASLAALGFGGMGAVVVSVVSAIPACFTFVAHGGRVSLDAAVVVLLTLATVLALARALAEALRQQRLLRLLPLEPADDERLIRLAGAAGLETLWLLPARRPGAFCFGLLRPRVVVTRGLLERLEPHEQAAAVWHEAQHARVHEPLRCLLARLAAASFFWLPTLSDLADRYLLAKELHADRVAAARTSPRALAAALGQVAARPVPAGAVGLGELAGARIGRLADPAAPLAGSWSGKRLALTAAAIAAGVVVASFPVRLDLSACARVGPLLATVAPEGAAGLVVAVVLCSLVLLMLAHTARRR